MEGNTMAIGIKGSQLAKEGRSTQMEEQRMATGKMADSLKEVRNEKNVIQHLEVAQAQQVPLPQKTLASLGGTQKS